MAPPLSVFFLAGPREGKKDPFLSAHIPQKMRFDIARLREIHAAQWGSAGPPSAQPQRPRITALSDARMHNTRGGGSSPSGLSGPSGRLERFDIASELDGVPQKHNPYGYVWTAPRYSLITHAALRGRNRPIFRGAGHGGPRAQVQGPVRPHNGLYVLPAPRGAIGAYERPPD